MEDCPVFTPTLEEFKDFSKFIETIQPKCKGGLAKVIPPPEWEPEFTYDKLENLVIPHPIRQYVTGNKGIYQLLLVESPSVTLEEFKEIAAKEKIPKSAKYDYDDNERIFWKNVRFQPPMYGADMPGSLFTENTKYWNLRDLHTMLNVIGSNLPGITTPYLYFGMWKAMFAWHVEDMNLFSINYLHFGQPKTWYGVGAEHGARFEQIVKSYFPDQAKGCPEFLRHKTSMVSPSLLLQHNIPVTHAIQEPGQFMITFPYGYHCGFNNGFNCAEAVNFAVESWIDWGVKAKPCKCRSDTVKIDMGVLLQRYQAYKDGTFQLEDHQHINPFQFETNLENDDVQPLPLLGGMMAHVVKHKSPRKPSTPKKAKTEGSSTTTTQDAEHKSEDVDLNNDEGTEEVEGAKRKRGKRVNEEEMKKLEELYEKHYRDALPDRAARERIAAQLDWTPQGIYNWFRRRKLKDSGPSLKEEEEVSVHVPQHGQQGAESDQSSPASSSSPPPSSPPTSTNSSGMSPPHVTRTPSKTSRRRHQLPPLQPITASSPNKT